MNNKLLYYDGVNNLVLMESPLELGLEFRLFIKYFEVGQPSQEK